MKNLYSLLKKFWKDESAQGATEYILLLVVVVTIALMFRKKITELVGNKMGELEGGVGKITVDE